MIISFENFSLFVNTTYFNPDKTTVLFIHGFTGSLKNWQKILPEIDKSFSRISIDLIGHGNSSSPQPVYFYEIDSIVQQIKKVLDELKINKVILAGYSMGGRVALSFADEHPENVKGLILESTTAGIEDENERAERFQNDSDIAKILLKDGIKKFVLYWMNLPIFASQKNLSEKKLLEIIKHKLLSNPQGLANSLLGFSTGKMPPLWKKLSEFNCPVLLLAGEMDEKFSSINERMNDLLPNSEFHIIKNAGHNIHLEKPSEFIILVNSFLQTNFL